MDKKLVFCAAAVALSVTGCIPAGQHRDAVRDDSADGGSLATVQREIHPGMSGAEDISVPGSPAVVATDGERRETAGDDEVTTERAYPSSLGILGRILDGSATVPPVVLVP